MRESVHAPSVRARINLRRFNKPAVDLKSLPAADANYLITNARIGASAPRLLVNFSRTVSGPLAEWDWFTRNTRLRLRPLSMTCIAFHRQLKCTRKGIRHPQRVVSGVT